MQDEKSTSTDAPEQSQERIQDLPVPAATPESESDVKGGWLPPKVPSPAGPIPIPYPNLP